MKDKQQQWKARVENDLAGSLASIGAMLEHNNEFLHQAFEAVLQHNNQVDARLDALEKSNQEAEGKPNIYGVLIAQRDVLSIELNNMRTVLDNLKRDVNSANHLLRELLDKTQLSKEEPKPELPRKELHPWLVKHIFKADQVYKEAGAWYLTRKHNGNAQSLGCYTLRELYDRNKSQLRKNKLEDELSSLS